MAKNIEEVNAAEELLNSLNESVDQSEQFFEKNSKLIYGIVGAIVVGLLLTFFFKNLSIKKNLEAGNELFEAEQAFLQDSLTTALNGKSGSFIGFTEAIEEYSGTETANMANYYSGIAYYKQGEYSKAITSLEEFHPSDDILSAVRLGLLGDAHVQNKEKENGLSFYQKAIEVSDLELPQVTYSRKAAILALSMRKKETAKNILNDFLISFPEAANKQEFELLLEQAN